MLCTGSSTGSGELIRRPEKRGADSATTTNNNNNNNANGSANFASSISPASGGGTGTGKSATGGAWGNSFAFTIPGPCADSYAGPDATTNPITYKYFDVSLSEAAVSTLRLLVNCYPSHPVSHHINDSSMEPRTIYLLGQCGAVELVLRLLTLFVESVKSRNLVKSRFDKITQQLTRSMGGGGGRAREYKRAAIVEEEDNSDGDDDSSAASSESASASANSSVSANASVGGGNSVSARGDKSSDSTHSRVSAHTAHTANTLKSGSTSHAHLSVSARTAAPPAIANTATFLMYKQRPSPFATVLTGTGAIVGDTAAASSAPGHTGLGSGAAVTADNMRDTRTVYSALECLYCLSSNSYKHPNRAILEANHALDQVLMACDVLAGEAVVFHWACTLIGMLYSKRVAKSHVNGRLCRLLIQALANFTHEIAICEYGLKSLAFVAYVAVAVSNTESSSSNGGGKATADIIAPRPTAEYLNEAGAMSLATRLFLYHCPTGSNPSPAGNRKDDLAIHALTSAFLSMGNMCHHYMHSKMEFLARTYVQKMYHPTGDYSHSTWICFLEGALMIIKGYVTRLAKRKTLARQKADLEKRVAERKRKGLGLGVTATDADTFSLAGSVAGESVGTDDSQAHNGCESYESKYGVLDADTYALFASYFHCLGNVLSFPRFCTHRDSKLYKEVLMVSAQYAETSIEMPYLARSGQDYIDMGDEKADFDKNTEENKTKTELKAEKQAADAKAAAIAAAQFANKDKIYINTSLSQSIHTMLCLAGFHFPYDSTGQIPNTGLNSIPFNDAYNLPARPDYHSLMMSPAQYWYAVGEEGKKLITELGDGKDENKQTEEEKDQDEYSALDRQLKEYLLLKEKEKEMAEDAGLQYLQTLQNTYANASRNGNTCVQYPMQEQEQGRGQQGHVLHLPDADGKTHIQHLQHTSSELAIIEKKKLMQHEKNGLRDSSSIFSEEQLAINHISNSGIQYANGALYFGTNSNKYMNNNNYNYNVESASSTDVDDHLFFDMTDPEPPSGYVDGSGTSDNRAMDSGNVTNGSRNAPRKNGNRLFSHENKKSKHTVSFAGLELNQHGMYVGPGAPDASSLQGTLEGSVTSIEYDRDSSLGNGHTADQGVGNRNGAGGTGYGYGSANEYGGYSGSTRRDEGRQLYDEWGNPIPIPHQLLSQVQLQTRHEPFEQQGGQMSLYHQQQPEYQSDPQQIQEHSADYVDHDPVENFEYVYSEEEIRAYDHQHVLLAAAEAEVQKEQARLSLETRVSERIQSRYGGSMATILRGRKPLTPFEQAVCIPNDPLAGVGAGAAYGDINKYNYNPDDWNIQNPFYMIPAAQKKEKFIQEIPILPRINMHRQETETHVYETFQPEALPIYRADGTKVPSNHLSQESFTDAGRGVAAMQLRLIFEHFAPYRALDVASILRSCDTAKRSGARERYVCACVCARMRVWMGGLCLESRSC